MKISPRMSILIIILVINSSMGALFFCDSKEQCEISCNLSFSSASVGTPVLIYGYIIPKRVANITIQMSSNNGTIWNNLAMVLTNPDGNYSYLWFPNKGEYLVKSYVPEYQDYFNATSQTQKIVVSKTLSKITCEISSTQIILGENITIFGNITPTFSDEVITICISSDELSWDELSKVKTSSGGNFLFELKANTSGTYYFKAFWAGDDVFMEAESAKCKLIVEAEADFTIYYIILILFGIIATGYLFLKRTYLK